jgi:hypothetical protein
MVMPHCGHIREPLPRRSLNPYHQNLRHDATLAVTQNTRARCRLANWLREVPDMRPDSLIVPPPELSGVGEAAPPNY